MKRERQVWSVILARGGSKGLLGKNLAALAGKPLVDWSIEAGMKAAGVDRVILSSDDDNILARGRAHGCVIHKRSAAMAADQTTSAESLQDLLQGMDREVREAKPVCVLLQPTSPLRTSLQVDEALAVSQQNEWAPVISVCEPRAHPMKAYKVSDEGTLTGLFSPDAPYMPRQELPQALMPNGAIYIFDGCDMMKTGAFPANGVLPYQMSSEQALDIDGVEDLVKAESYLSESRT